MEISTPTRAPAPRRNPWPRGRWGRYFLTLLVLTLTGLFWGGCQMFSMPGESYRGPLPAISPEQSVLAQRLQSHVEMLANRIGPRDLHAPEKLEAAARYVEMQLAAAGYTPVAQTYRVAGVPVRNIEVALPGVVSPDEILVVGAHYDSVPGCPAANDNGSGVAALLELARALKGAKPARTIRLVAFVNEEPPYFQTSLMGSMVYAARCKDRKENIVGMLALETMGYYTDAPDSQHYPGLIAWLYPSTGNFIAFVGNYDSRQLVYDAIASFRQHAKFPSEGGAVPDVLAGVGWSDHWSFWQQGYPALMVTDTAPFRYPHYHSPADTPEKLDFGRLARVTDGLAKVLADLADR